MRAGVSAAHTHRAVEETGVMDWLFQCDPKRYDLKIAIERGDPDGDWSMNQGRKLVSPGDRVFFWETGPQARLLAVGHVTSPVYERETSFGHYHVDIAFDYKIVPPLTRPEALKNEPLAKFAPFKGLQGTNFRMDDPAIVSALDTAVESRLVPFSAKHAPDSPIEDSQKSLDAAIKRAKHEATNKVRDHITHMDPTAFEWLARALFLKLGYKNVVVTKRSGDGGVDVTATLDAGGVANIKTCIQAKRQQSVGRPVVQNLRGSLSAHEAGLLVTSGQFTSGAVEEANDPTKPPIALIDGSRLTELLLEHKIGVEHRNVTLYSLKLGDLSQEQLEARVDERRDSDS
jgi:hypothetical protein